MSKSTGWAAFGVIAVVGVVIASCAVAASSDSPRGFIGDNYSCDVDPTENDVARCDDSGSPSNVADAISLDTRPVDTERAGDNVTGYDCDDAGNSTYGPNDDVCTEAGLPRDDQSVYLQYEDDLVVVSKDDDGCAINVYDYDEGYSRHSSHFAVFGWSSSRPSSSRGGFGGFGK